MWKVISACILCALGFPVVAQDNPAADYLECFNIKDSDDDRLTCYDSLSRKMLILSNSLRGRIHNSSGGCKIEAWNFKNQSNTIKLTGSTTCSSGRLDYRLYTENGGQFITSGFTYIKGFAFQTYADGSPQDELLIRYTIE